MLQAIGGAAAVGLAGCSGGGDGGGSGDGGGGERVPAIAMEYWSNLGGPSKIMEDASPTIKKNLEERLGITLNVKPVEFTTQINNVIQDERTHNLAFWYHTNTPDRLDPEEMTRRYGIDWAGGNGQANPTNYANCEFTYDAVQQGNATSEQERREFVNAAHGKMSEDLGTLPLTPNLLFGAIRTDAVRVAGIGDAGIARTNPHFYIQSQSKGPNQLVGADTPVAMETTNFPVIDSSAAQAIWNHLVHSTLLEYDENFELQNVLAENVETSSDAKTVTVTLRDATFHNGDPITAEDVKFTYLQLANNPGAYPQAASPPYGEVRVIDEKTAEFNMREPYPPLTSKVFPRWGVFHKQTWVNGGAPDDPEGFEMDQVIGSGPFKMRQFSVGSSMDLTPHDGHPTHSPSYDLFLQAYRNEQTTVQAFQAGEVQFAPNLSPGALENIKQNVGGKAMTNVTQGFMPFIIYPQYSWSPSQFREFRAAVGAAIDRKAINAIAMRGESKPQLYSCPLQFIHPWRPPDGELTKMTDSETGSEEQARKALEDAGWGWDGDGNLRYPADKDLSPRWPKGQTPDPSQFPCLSGESEYNEGYQPSGSSTTTSTASNSSS